MDSEIIHVGLGALVSVVTWVLRHHLKRIDKLEASKETLEKDVAYLKGLINQGRKP